MANKLEHRWGEGFYLGRLWRSGEAILGTPQGIEKAGTIKRTGAHRRWDGEGLSSITGVPWKWNPDEDDPNDDLLVRWLSEQEKEAVQPNQNIDQGTIYRMRLKKDDFYEVWFHRGLARIMLSSLEHLRVAIMKRVDVGCRRRWLDMIKDENDLIGRTPRRKTI